MTMALLAEIMEVVVIPLLGILTAYVVKLVNAKIEDINKERDNVLEEKYLTMLGATISDCVTATTQTYVESLKKQGKFNNDTFMQKFYNSFAIDSSIKLDRKQKLFDNPTADVVFFLENDQTLLSTIGLFCREYSMDLVKKNPVVARALRKIKDYVAAELLDIFNL